MAEGLLRLEGAVLHERRTRRFHDRHWWVQDPESKFYNRMHTAEGADFPLTESGGVPRATMDRFMGWVEPSANPRIAIG
ncbi:hypothetical protein ABT034_01980 [Streptomyces sp. NPDC002773]|uniref:hypothetical protein n=1 Tax=Streptomyces sp. NPDC002773 TaxID=3154430 RepID=UPI0033303DEC